MVQKILLMELRFRMALAFKFRVNMPIGNKDVRPAVVIIIEEAAAPAQIFQIETQFGVESSEGEAAVVLVAIEIRHIIFKVRLENVEPAIAIVVGRGNAHSGLLSSIFIIGDAVLHAALFKRAVAFIAKKEAGSGIAGDVNVR